MLIPRREIKIVYARVVPEKLFPQHGADSTLRCSSVGWVGAKFGQSGLEQEDEDGSVHNQDEIQKGNFNERKMFSDPFWN